MQYHEENNYPKAFACTTLIVAVLFVLCYMVIMPAATKPPDGTGGILVNYGTTDEGKGDDLMSLEEASKADRTSKVKPDKITPISDDKTNAETSDKKVVTQSTEDAPVVSDNSKKPSNTIATETQKAAAKPTVNQAALYHGAKPTTGSGGDGTTNTPGNQGSTNGSNLSDNYGPGGSGTGLNMPHWDVVTPPDVTNIHRVQGTVVIDFIVEPNGTVIQASSNRQKTRATLDLIQSCIDAIKRTKFHSSTTVTGNTPGQYTWKFQVD